MENGYKCIYEEKSEEVLSYNGKKIITGRGFNWGYNGSGPQDMASAIAKHYTNNNSSEEEKKIFLYDVIVSAEKEKDLFISEYQVSRYFSKSHNLSQFQIIEQYVNEYAKNRKEILDNPLDYAYLIRNYLNEKSYEPTEYVIFNYLTEYFKNDYSPSIYHKKNSYNEKQEILNALKIICKHFDITNDDLFKL
jgi:hypothetical protein